MAALLQGKVAAITGAVTGIGRAIALDYLRHGASVAVNYYPDDKSASQFEALSKEVGEDARLIGVPGDITKPETGQELVKKTVEKFGRLDVFVSNAGVCQFADFLTYAITCVWPLSCMTDLATACRPTWSTTLYRQTSTAHSLQCRRRRSRCRRKSHVVAVSSVCRQYLHWWVVQDRHIIPPPKLAFYP